MLTRDEFHSRFGTRPLIGMVHLRSLPGAPLYVSLDEVLEAALRDAEALAAGGADAIMVENFGDKPFFKKVGAETVAAMTRVITEIARSVALPFGVNVLRNDGGAALAIAAATGASFVRVNVLTGAAVTDQGIIEGEAAALLRLRATLAPQVLIFADHRVKHASALGDIEPLQAVRDLRLRALADAVILSGSETGRAVDSNEARGVREVVDAPLLVGSGLSLENAAELRLIFDGAIVGSSIKSEGRLDQPVDAKRLAALRAAFIA